MGMLVEVPMQAIGSVRMPMLPPPSTHAGHRQRAHAQRGRDWRLHPLSALPLGPPGSRVRPEDEESLLT